MLKLKKRLSLLFGVALFGCAHVHESPMGQTLQPMFESINQRYFGGELKGVEVRWANLTTEDARGLTRLFTDGSFLIEMDRASNTTQYDATFVLEHEACHVLTQSAIQKMHSDLHSRTFTDCMRRFEREAPSYRVTRYSHKI
jgi:hypothetical protein